MSVIPAAWEAEIRRIVNQDQLRQNVSETPSKSISWARWHASVIIAMWGA
jgi:hypothetical protein